MIADPRIVVVGAGAMGSLFGGLLSEGGLRVTLVTTRADHVAAIREQGGLKIVGFGGDRLIPIAATTDPARIAQADIVLFQCKAAANAAAAQSVLHLFGASDTVAISFQNGLGNEEAIAAVVGQAAVLGGLTAMGARLEAPGTVRNFADLPTTIGELAGGLSDRAVALAALLSAHGLPADAVADVMRRKWTKLFANLAFSATSGATGLTLGEVADTPELRRVALAAIDEAVAVAAATGIVVDPDEARSVFHQLVGPGGAGANTTSMYRDLAAGRMTEVDQIYGTVVALGRRHGLATPTLDALLAIVKGLERRQARH